ncbi:MAG: hypothetical protein IT361_16450 [Gemmatimonadaceae bacterium]|nr:hypothetical protein [Gemmatimonadaceae bacterium]
MPARSITRSFVALALVFASANAEAQYLTRPTIPWETITTTSFRFHYPASMRTWVRPIAERMEQYASAVNQLVGSRPGRRVTVMVEDPTNVANGFAIPLLDSPTIFLWPTPPTPSPTFGTHRGWGEVLAVHEYAHIAHLTVRPRNATERLLWRMLPARVGPVARKAPPWVFEGYATYIEGRLTGSGRPNSVGRPAILRQWALEGQLPRYAELNGTRGYLGGAMRYLVGSAFLEWLAVRRGDSSLQHLWRRMSAVERRSFTEAFRGVYGAPPDELYGAFATDVMEKALDVRRTLRQAGLVEGDLVQRLAWGTGDPAVSRDGRLVAVVVRSATGPARVLVWRTANEGLDSGVVRGRRQQLARDPQDVMPYDSFPPHKRAVATLHPSRGRGHDAPRWFADNQRLLLSRDETLGDGATRPDLFIWNHASGRLRRVTRGAGIRSADPAPDGRTAVGVRCRAGICDVVRVDLERGSWTTIAAGSPTVVFHRARLSNDGQRIAVSVQRDGVWSVSILDARTGAETSLPARDGVARYSPSWTPDGRLVTVSEAGGIANLEVLDPATHEGRAITRVTGGVAGPDVGPDGRVWFLNLHARGYDLRRVPSGAPAATVVSLDPRSFPAAPRRAEPGRTFAPGPINGPSDYALGPRGWRALPGISVGPDGDMGSLMVGTVDPVGRWSTLLQGAYGQRGAWRGGSAMTTFRTTLVEIDGSLWYGDHAPSKQRSGSFASLNIDSRFTGLGVSARKGRELSAYGWALRAGGSAGRVDGNQLDAASRAMGFGEVRGRLSLPLRGATITPRVAASVTEGSTDGDRWTRRLVTASLTVGGARRELRLEATRGSVTEPGPGEFGRAFEQFAVGGAYLPFIDQAYLSQRISLPSVPVGYTSGRRVEMYRASMRLFRVHPYATWIAAGDSVTSYRRVLGLENEFAFPTIGFVTLPSTRIRFGVGYSLDEPYEEKMRPYVSVTYRP